MQSNHLLEMTGDNFSRFMSEQHADFHFKQRQEWFQDNSRKEDT